MKLTILSSLALALPLAMFGQAQATLDTPYQINYASNLGLADAVINITNDGASALGVTPTLGPSANVPVGYICANVYVYAPDQELAACCSCPLSPNSLHSFPVSFGPNSLLANVNNTTVLGSINNSNSGTRSLVIKLYATAPNSDGSCRNPATPLGPAVGMVAWGTHAHPTNIAGVASLTETPFVPATLSDGERGKLTYDCNALQGAGSGTTCPLCRTGGLAAPAAF